MSKWFLSLPALTFVIVGLAPALCEAAADIDIHKISAGGVGEKVGSVKLTDSEKGLVFTFNITGLPPGDRGLHVHERGDCGPGEKDGRVQAGLAAGDHYDPEMSKTHAGPHGQGHKGDLPILKLTGQESDVVVVAPRLRLSDVAGRAVVIHEGGDTYSDKPESGGGKGVNRSHVHGIFDQWGSDSAKALWPCVISFNSSSTPPTRRRSRRNPGSTQSSWHNPGCARQDFVRSLGSRRTRQTGQPFR